MLASLGPPPAVSIVSGELFIMSPARVSATPPEWAKGLIEQIGGLRKDVSNVAAGLDRLRDEGTRQVARLDEAVRNVAEGAAQVETLASDMEKVKAAAARADLTRNETLATLTNGYRQLSTQVGEIGRQLSLKIDATAPAVAGEARSVAEASTRTTKRTRWTLFGLGGFGALGGVGYVVEHMADIGHALKAVAQGLGVLSGVMAP